MFLGSQKDSVEDTKCYREFTIILKDYFFLFFLVLPQGDEMKEYHILEYHQVGGS